MTGQLLTAAFGAWARGRVGKVERLGRDPVEVQRKTLSRLLQAAAETSFGKEHAFRRITRHSGFASAVPVRRYAQFVPWIDRQLSGEADVCWPGRPRYFAKTSGTTAGDKSIPVTEEMVGQNRRAGRDILAFHLRNTPGSGILGGRQLFLGGSTLLEPLPTGAFRGDLSGVMAREMPFYLRPGILPSPGVVAIAGWEKKLEAIAKESLSQDLRLIAGMPSWSLLLFEAWKRLSGGATVGELFPRLELFVHGGVRYEPYQAPAEAAVGRGVRRLEVYPASEAFIAVQDAAPADGLLLGLDYGTFYEFIPAAEAGSDSPRRLGIGDVSLGETYSIVLSNVAGLWAYEIGDLVRFVSITPPRLVVAGRTGHFSNCCGENLIVEEVEAGATTAAAACRLPLGEFTVAPVYPDAVDSRPRLEWVVELPDDEPFLEEPLLIAFDRTLRARNHDYDTKRTHDAGMLQPVLTVVPSGTFHAWLRSRGKLGGQNKVPRLMNDRSIVDSVLGAVRPGGHPLTDAPGR